MRTTLLVAVAALGLAACGGSGSNHATASASSTSTLAASSTTGKSSAGSSSTTAARSTGATATTAAAASTTTPVSTTPTTANPLAGLRGLTVPTTAPAVHATTPATAPHATTPTTKPPTPTTKPPGKPTVASASMSSCTIGTGTLNWTAHVTLSNGKSGNIGPESQTDPSTKSYSGTIGGYSVTLTVYSYSYASSVPYCLIDSSKVN